MDNMQTAESHNSQLTGRVEFIGKSHPVTPKPHESHLFAIGRTRVGFHKDAKWLARVRKEPCIWHGCGLPGPSQPHHVFGSYMTAKTSDYATIPLCPEHHEKVEASVELRNECVALLAVFMGGMMHKQLGESL